MRASRLVLVTGLVLAATAGLAVGSAQAAPTPPYTAVTGSGDPFLSDNAAFAFAGTAVAVPTHVTTDKIQFVISRPAPSSALTVTVSAPTGGGSLTTMSSTQVTDSATDSAPGFDITDTSDTCGSVSGTLRIDELKTDTVDTTDIIAFAAHYSFRCDGNASPIYGELRYQSTLGYAAVTENQSTWDFGPQLIGKDGWAKTFVFTNAGTAAQSFSSASTGSSIFRIKANTCTTAPVAAGGTCTITVAPHPVTVGLTVSGTLMLTPSASPDLVPPTVQLRVLGSNRPDFYGIVGPQRVDLNWGQLPMPFTPGSNQVQIYRGSSASTLSLLRTVSGSEYVDHPAAGHTYYYAVRPRLLDGTLGDRSPVIAARPWPKYSAGMYHRLSSPARFLSAHRVSAGHPYSLKVLGVHGVPSANVSAVAVNVTAASSTATTKVYVYPAGSSRPAAADIAVRAHDTRSNFVLAKVGKTGRITISTANGSVPVSVDVFGYFSAAGLSSKYGQGGALHEYGYPGTIMDTKGYNIGALKHDYYVNAPVNFDPVDTPHVKALLVEVTAYGSKGSGSITGFTTNGRPSGTSVLSYRPGITTSSVALLRPGLWYSSSSGNYYPSVSFLNRGSKPVQLYVTILGYVDDNTFLFGQRYIPTAPVHLMGRTMYSGSNATIAPGKHGNIWTTAFNEKLSATHPSKTTTVSLRAIGFGPAPSRGQLHAPARVTTVSSTVGVTGTRNRIGVHNSAGTVRVDVWSFGRFDAYPVPTTLNYASATAPNWLRPAPTALVGDRFALRMN